MARFDLSHRPAEVKLFGRLHAVMVDAHNSSNTALCSKKVIIGCGYAVLFACYFLGLAQLKRRVILMDHLLLDNDYLLTRLESFERKKNANTQSTATKMKKMFCKGEAEILELSRNGSYYSNKCTNHSMVADIKDDGETKHDNTHHYLLPKTDIILLNQRIGHVKRVCDVRFNENYDGDINQHLRRYCLLPTIAATTPVEQQQSTHNVNSPMPIRVKPWMKHPSFRGQSIILYYSSHTKNSISVLGLDASTRQWNKLDDALSFGNNNPCKSLHSPSVFVNDVEERFYMYIHGHSCISNTGKREALSKFQPTLLFISEDGISWKMQTEEWGNKSKTKRKAAYNYLFWNLFYVTNPIYNTKDGHYYAMARKKNDSSVILCRSTSPRGPYEEGPQLGHGLRHVDIFYHTDGMIYVLFSMIGDRPERILLGSIDTTNTAQSSASNNWKDWKLLPGPRILEPQYVHEHDDEPLVASEEGPAKTRHQVNDPRLLLDEKGSKSNVNATTIISGLLFYTVQGERGIATARISIDLALYRGVTSYWHHANIQREVLDSSSLARSDDTEANSTIANLLITGVGRTGTTSMCTLLRKFGIMVSHDTDMDCGPYPGADGAVSWYDAFKAKGGSRYRHVIHLVRDPLRTINSRIVKCEHHGHHKHLRQFLKTTLKPYEEVANNESCSSFALKNWVRRNTFVESHASWRVMSESVFSDPLSVWELCMVAGFGDRCPELWTIKEHLDSMPHKLNSLYSGATLSKAQERREINLANVSGTDGHSWESLARAVGQHNYNYIRIAQMMAYRYGYEYNVPSGLAPFDFYCEFTRRRGKTYPYKNWDCFLQ